MSASSSSISTSMVMPAAATLLEEEENGTNSVTNTNTGTATAVPSSVSTSDNALPTTTTSSPLHHSHVAFTADAQHHQQHLDSNSLHGSNAFQIEDIDDRLPAYLRPTTSTLTSLPASSSKQQHPPNETSADPTNNINNTNTKEYTPSSTPSTSLEEEDHEGLPDTTGTHIPKSTKPNGSKGTGSGDDSDTVAVVNIDEGHIDDIDNPKKIQSTHTHTHPHKKHRTTCCNLIPLPPKPTLLTQKDMPPWYQHTPYIRNGYREINNSVKLCLQSLFYVHNETGNFWSHAIGSAYFVALMGYTTFHLFCCHSKKVQGSCLKADYLGIVVLIVGSFIPIIYLAFYCTPLLQGIYLAMITSAGIGTVFINVNKRFLTPHYRPLRTILFIATGVSGIIPITHASILNGLAFTKNSLAFNYVITEGLLFILGAMLFLFQIPERWVNGMFDYWGNSHQIFHCLIVVASTVHYLGVLRAFRFWKGGNPWCSVALGDMDVSGSFGIGGW
ncbi:hypothetical protein HDU76_010501 [Blyttiomyces sp. JEL0837]|nr:hypothetical protein HDU76_010501 [Blyttiomyces sp. JEL0837]